MTLLLTNAGWIQTGDPARPVIENGHVLIEGGRIVAIGSGGGPDNVAERIDLGGALLLPGFINLHHHFFQSITRATPAVHRTAALPWLGGLYPIWSLIEAEDMAVAVRQAAAELLLSGVTTSVDHAFLLRSGAARLTDTEVTATREMGLRLHLVRGCLPDVGPLEPELKALMGTDIGRLVDTDAAVTLEESRQDIARHHDPAPGAMVRLALGPSTIPYGSPDLLTRIAAVADDTRCGLHMHYHPWQGERRQCQQQFGFEPIELLQRHGWLRPSAWFAHCTQLAENDIQAFAAHGVGAAHCPRTILRLGYGIPPISRMRQAGIPIGVGIDGSASNDGAAYIADLRLALLLHRIGTADSAEPLRDWMLPADALQMATTAAARIIGRDDIGSLRVGQCADLAAFDLRGIDCAGSLIDPLGGFLMAGTATRAKLTVVNGNVLVRDGQLTRVSETAIADDTNRIAESILRRAEARYGLRFRTAPLTRKVGSTSMLPEIPAF